MHAVDKQSCQEMQSPSLHTGKYEVPFEQQLRGSLLSSHCSPSLEFS